MAGASVMTRVTGHLARAARFPMQLVRARPEANADAESDARRRAETVRFHLGRGRRAREAGRYTVAVREARRALAENPYDPWALALLGQCLLRQSRPDLLGARRALQLAQALDPTNGYFVRLLLEVLDVQGDAAGRADALAWAWWSGAPIERWLPEGPPLTRAPSASASGPVRSPHRTEHQPASVSAARREPVLA